MRYLLLLFFISSCASTIKNVTKEKSININEDSFKKEKPLTKDEVSDFYSTQASVVNPALQDETIDRFNISELNKMKIVNDPLLDISIRCKKKDFKSAFELANKNFNRYFKVPSYWNQIGNCHLNSGSFRKALLFYNKALELSPEYVPSLNNIGVMYTRLGQDQKALIAFERASRLSKFSKTPRYNLARIYLIYGLAQKARPIFESLLSSSPQDVDLLNATAVSCYLMSDSKTAEIYFQKIPKSYLSKPEFGLNLSLFLKQSGKKDEALRVFSTVEKSKDEVINTYYDHVKTQMELDI